MTRQVFQQSHDKKYRATNAGDTDHTCGTAATCATRRDSHGCNDDSRNTTFQARFGHEQTTSATLVVGTPRKLQHFFIQNVCAVKANNQLRCKYVYKHDVWTYPAMPHHARPHRREKLREQQLDVLGQNICFSGRKERRKTSGSLWAEFVARRHMFFLSYSSISGSQNIRGPTDSSSKWASVPACQNFIARARWCLLDLTEIGAHETSSDIIPLSRAQTSRAHYYRKRRPSKRLQDLPTLQSDAPQLLGYHAPHGDYIKSGLPSFEISFAACVRARRRLT